MFIQLIFDRLNNFGVSMTNIADSDAGNHVNIFFSVWRIEKNSFCLFNFNEKWIGRGLS